MQLFGIAILIVSLMLFFIPMLGGYLTLIPALIGVWTGKKGAIYVMIGVFLNGLHVLLFSDFIRFNAVTGIHHGKYLPAVIYIGLALAQVVVGLILWFRHFSGEIER
ncbi:MAG: hypothetical protein HQL94_04490 [Magnetococcales bacterium]|nr:hypothetical protein [Magnetococcales bacterium]